VDDRETLLALLEAHAARWPEDGARAARIADFVRAHDDCLLRTCRPGHLTGSAWIVSPAHEAVLLVHHRKLGRWLQPGGHADGDADLFRVAEREARKETGLATLAPVPAARPPVPFDLDVHGIPARGEEPAHLHHDVRFLLVATPGERPAPSEEATAVRWVPLARLGEFTAEESIHRMARRAEALLAALGRDGEP
jgi:ADP-ribose pyrophosphatase YjhB (NUDIX family)